MTTVDPQQSERPIQAMVSGEPYLEVPADLFIPPDALEVLLDSFSGPLDLLLYLIRRQNIDIMDIPIVTITRQYMDYMTLMKQKRLELAADYLVMAAVLAEIKSRLLLPQVVRAEDPDAVEDDPRMVLVRRLQVYEQFKQAAEALDALSQCERDVYRVQLKVNSSSSAVVVKPLPEVTLVALVNAMRSVLLEKGHTEHHAVQREQLSVRERMAYVLQRVMTGQYLELTQLFVREEGRMGLVVSLLAILELAKQSLLLITQTVVYDPIYIRAVGETLCDQ